MTVRTHDLREDKSQSIAGTSSKQQGNREPAVQFIENLHKTTAQSKMLEAANSSSQVKQLKAYQFMADNHSKEPIQRKEKSTEFAPLPIQRNKNAQEMQGIEGFKYEDITTWNGTPCIHKGIKFISDETIRFMSANGQTKEVRYNPKDVGPMTPPSRYFLILHELSHIYYNHPGNAHQDSIENEIQADDSALVNAFTHYPEKSSAVVGDFAALLQNMINQGIRGGNTHPPNDKRKARLLQLMNTIMDTATLDVSYTSNWIPKGEMDAFFLRHGPDLMMDAGDFKHFQAENGPFSYVNGGGKPKLRLFLHWLPIYHQKKDLIPNFKYTANWIIRPVTIQNQIKDNLP